MKSNKLDLHKNTISELHDNLMVYYDLGKEKQELHQRVSQQFQQTQLKMESR